ncbi:MAG: (d)CMP kinase [Promethearchaeota archaeon]
MIVTISGLHGTGKSIIGKKIASIFGLKYYSTGQVFREMAREYNMTLEQFTKYVEENPEIDKQLDHKILDLAREDNIIIDSQLSAYILKSKANFKILLTCSIDTRVKRMAERDKTSFEKKMRETVLREKSEEKRFKELYDINLNDQEYQEKTYDLIIDTTNLTIDQIVNKIVGNIKKTE